MLAAHKVSFQQVKITRKSSDKFSQQNRTSIAFCSKSGTQRTAHVPFSGHLAEPTHAGEAAPGELAQIAEAALRPQHAAQRRQEEERVRPADRHVQHQENAEPETYMTHVTSRAKKITSLQWLDHNFKSVTAEEAAQHIGTTVT